MIPVSEWKPSWATLSLAGLLVWAPLPFASITPGGLLTLRIGVAVALCAALVESRRRLLVPGLGPPAAALLAIAALGVVQALPLPRGLVGRLAPERLELAAAADPGAAGGMPLSLAPAQSLSAALTFVTLAAALVVAAHLGRERLGRRWLLGGVLGAAFFQLLYGSRHLAAGSNAIWGREVGRAGSRMRGTFVNPAHLAPYLEIALAIALAFAWWSFARARRAGRSPEIRLALIAGPLLLWLLFFAGLAFTRSRAGLTAAVLATLVQGALLAARARRWRLLPIGLGAGAAGLGLVAWIGLEQGLGRLLGTSPAGVAANARFDVWRGTVELWRRFPLAGTGLGSFEASFPMVEDPRLATVSWQHAHNDWLELLATGGPLALAAAVIGAAALAWRLQRLVTSAASAEAAAAALAGAGALVAVAFHELFDFGLTLPANALTLAVVLGVAAAGGAARSQRSAAGPGRAAPPA